MNNNWTLVNTGDICKTWSDDLLELLKYKKQVLSGELILPSAVYQYYEKLDDDPDETCLIIENYWSDNSNKSLQYVFTVMLNGNFKTRHVTELIKIW